MANIKKLALGLLVAVFAFGFSAFKNVKISNQASVVFYHYAASNNYQTAVPPATLDCGDDDFWCTIEYNGTGTLPSATFSETSIPPAGSGITRILNDPDKGYK